MLKIIIGIFAAVAAAIFITTQDVDIKETNDESIAIQIEEIDTSGIEEIDTSGIEEIDTSGIEFKKLSKPRPLITNTVTNSDELYDVLSKANNGDVIYIPGQIKVNLTPTLKKIKNKYPPRFEIPAGVTIMGDGERFGENGATLYITDDVKDEVFRLNEGVNVIGLRIKGPGIDCDLVGLQAYISPEDTIIIENCEIWGWNNAAIRNRGDSTKLSLRNNMIIRNNYIHDTIFGTGYGIATAFNSYTLIEYNKFSNNRHDVSASGKYGCDYTFRYNTNILQWTNQKTGKKAHIVDVHGWPFDARIKPEDRKRNRQAGSRIEIYGNHFKDSGDNEVIHIRGIPEFYIRIYDNKFATTNATPIEQKYIDVSDSSKKMEIKNNRFRVKF